MEKLITRVEVIVDEPATKVPLNGNN